MNVFTEKKIQNVFSVIHNVHPEQVDVNLNSEILRLLLSDSNVDAC